MAKLVFDIETAGEDFESLDEVTQKALTKWVTNSFNPDTEDYKNSLDKVKKSTVFVPTTSQIVAIGVLDYEKEKAVIYFQAPEKELEEFEEEGVRFKPATEEEMLKGFWHGAENYDEFISYNGRSFDVPFMMIRSAIYGIRPSKNLLGPRYLYQHRPGELHVDLQDQFTFYGVTRATGMSLHMLSRAFGIKSPKESGVMGDDVTKMFRDGKYLDIARYNVGDLRATKELYDYWKKYLAF
jgi:3'-5' exonuclease